MIPESLRQKNFSFWTFSFLSYFQNILLYFLFAYHTPFFIIISYAYLIFWYPIPSCHSSPGSYPSS